jgi:hypothetical protein
MPAHIAKRSKPGPQRPGFFVCALALLAIVGRVLTRLHLDPRHRDGGSRPALHVFAVITMAVLPTIAWAQVLVTSDYLARMDADNDGRVALVEYQDWMSYAFDGMDRDRDGVLSASELPGGKGGPLSRGEHRTRLAIRFNKQDANRDGFLDARELAAPPQ